MSRKVRVTIVFAAVLGLISLFGVVWGVIHHIEGGLLSVCWVDNHAYYSDTEQVDAAEGMTRRCGVPQDIVWDQSQIPLSIAGTKDRGTPLKGNSVEGKALFVATRDLNKQLGFNLFEVVPYGHSADATINFGEAFRNGGGPPGYVAHLKVNGKLFARAHIRSDVVSSPSLLHAVLQHELMHVAGAAHDPARWSIMYPCTKDDWQSGNLNTSHVTDNDKRLFNTLYNSPNID